MTKRMLPVSAHDTRAHDAVTGDSHYEFSKWQKSREQEGVKGRDLAEEAWAATQRNFRVERKKLPEKTQREQRQPRPKRRLTLIEIIRRTREDADRRRILSKQF